MTNVIPYPVKRVATTELGNEVMRFGVPGGEALPFEISAPAHETVVVYAKTTLEAINIFYHETRGVHVFNVRLMSDNE